MLLRCIIPKGTSDNVLLPQALRAKDLLTEWDSIYRYTYGINWRAIAAFVVGVAPNLPGFINSINPAIDVGVGQRPYTFAWLLGFVITSLIYVVLSTIFPPTETMIPRAILPDEVYDGEGGASVTIEGKAIEDDVERDAIGEEKWKKEEDELRVT